MDNSDYFKLKKITGETAPEFVERLDALGAGEFICRMAVRRQYHVGLDEAVVLCGANEKMRIRDIQNDILRFPNRSDYARSIWLHRNYPVGKDEAVTMVQKAKAFHGNA